MKYQRNVMNLVKSLFLSYLLLGILLCVFALLIWKIEVPDNVRKGMVIVLYILPALLGGFLLGKMQKEKKFLWGFLLGMLYILILFLIGGITMGFSKEIGLGLATGIFMSVMSGTLGGMLA